MTLQCSFHILKISALFTLFLPRRVTWERFQTTLTHGHSLVPPASAARKHTIILVCCDVCFPTALQTPCKHPPTLVCLSSTPRRSQTPTLVCCVAHHPPLQDPHLHWSSVFSASRHSRKFKLVCVSRPSPVPTVTKAKSRGTSLCPLLSDW